MLSLKTGNGGPWLRTECAAICWGPQKAASLHILFNLDVETDTVWVAALELANTSVAKPTVQTRCLQSSQGTGRDSVSVELGMRSPGWYQAHKPCWEAGFTRWCTASRWDSWAAPDAVATAVHGQTTGWVCFPSSYWLPGAVGMASISASQRGQEFKKQPNETENQELVFLHLFMI